MDNTLRVVIAGGRKFCSMPAYPGAEKKRRMMSTRSAQMKEAFAHIDRILEPYRSGDDPMDIEVVNGVAMGADTVGDLWSMLDDTAYSTPFPVTPSDWNIFGNRAGIIRNMRMGDYADMFGNGLLIDFYDGESPGSKHMISYAKETGLHTIIVPYDKKDFP